MSQWDIIEALQSEGGSMTLQELKEKFIKRDQSGLYRKIRKLKEYKIITVVIDGKVTIVQLTNQEVTGIGRQN